MNNQNNGLPQGVITSSTLNNNQPATNEKKKMAIKKPSFNKKTIIIIVAVILVLFLVVKLFSSGKKLFGNNDQQNEEEQLIQVDLPTEWGKTYALAAQSIYSTYETDRFDMAFINLDFINEPEMIIKYKDKTDKEFIVVYYIDQRNGKAKESKHFGNADIKLIYSLLDGESNFYLNIINSNKYGTYTLLSKVIAGTVVTPDISAKNDKELNAFIENYVVANYSILYYQVKLDNYAENFTTMYDRYEKYSQEIKEMREELTEKYASEVSKKNDDKPYLLAGRYQLTYGDYEYEEISNDETDNVASSYSNTIVTLNRDGTVVVKGITYNYILNGNLLTLDNGLTMTVDKDDHFVLSDEGGVGFACKNPYDATKEEGNKEATPTEEKKTEE